ncbi:MAG: energy-coupling factor ABC transporter ATP-binding protein [Desulfohalobiaceae bacterium]|nr:energy-coupling factor ABC transporter ATP-binding protein [Desulfohalobiaceae bacterium]
MPNDTSLLILENVSFSYPGSRQTVLASLDFQLNWSQRLGLIGPNGQGKTTFLHICVGLLPLKSGKILFKGTEVRTRRELRQLRREIGLVFQNPEDQLFCPTVLEDVAFGPLNLGFTPAQARERAAEVLDLVGLSGFEKRITHKLSGGEKKLLSLATILAMQPNALLLDEPTAGLDPETRETVIRIIKKLKLGLLIVSHDWDFLYQTTTELKTLEQGQLIKRDRNVLHQHVHYHPSGHVPHEHVPGRQAVVSGQ